MLVSKNAPEKRAGGCTSRYWSISFTRGFFWAMANACRSHGARFESAILRLPLAK